MMRPTTNRLVIANALILALNFFYVGSQSKCLQCKCGMVNPSTDGYRYHLYFGANFEGNITYFCGGSLISDRWFITSAHCVYKHQQFPNGTSFFMKLGRFGLGYYVMLHPNYNNITSENDIALGAFRPMKFGFSSTYGPVCLPEQNEEVDVGTSVVMTSLAPVENSTKFAIQGTSLSVLPVGQCTEIQNSSNNYFCTEDKGDTFCPNGEGNPVVSVARGTQATLIGIVSRSGCVGGDNRNIKISKYIDWILSVTGELKTCPK